MSLESLSATLASTTHVLLDFDGPVCSIFAGLPAPSVAARLCDVISNDHGGDLPPDEPRFTDPLEVLRWADEHLSWIAYFVDYELRDAEVEAANIAEPTPGAAEFLRACKAAGRPVAIVSNNSAPAIEAYLARTGVRDLVAHVEGRPALEPALMKPDPYLPLRAVAALGTTPATCMFVGDSTSDVQAALAIRSTPVGYANKPAKHARLADAGAVALVDSMHQLARAVATAGPVLRHS